MFLKSAVESLWVNCFQGGHPVSFSGQEEVSSGLLQYGDSGIPLKVVVGFTCKMLIERQVSFCCKCLSVASHSLL